MCHISRKEPPLRKYRSVRRKVIIFKPYLPPALPPSFLPSLSPVTKRTREGEREGGRREGRSTVTITRKQQHI